VSSATEFRRFPGKKLNLYLQYGQSSTSTSSFPHRTHFFVIFRRFSADLRRKTVETRHLLPIAHRGKILVFRHRTRPTPKVWNITGLL